MIEAIYNLIYLCPGSWYHDFHRKPLVKAISRHPSVKKVYIIEIPADLFHAPVKKPERLMHGIKSLFSVSRVEQNIFVYTPMIFLHQLVEIRSS